MINLTNKKSYLKISYQMIRKKIDEIYAKNQPQKQRYAPISMLNKN